MNDVLTHLDQSGAARMVDVSAKMITAREATASGCVVMRPATLELIAAGRAAKGDVIATARLVLQPGVVTFGWFVSFAVVGGFGLGLSASSPG